MVFYPLRVACKGEIAKSDLEKLVKEKEAVELKAAEQRQVILYSMREVGSKRVGLFTPTPYLCSVRIALQQYLVVGMLGSVRRLCDVSLCILICVCKLFFLLTMTDQSSAFVFSFAVGFGGKLSFFSLSIVIPMRCSISQQHIAMGKGLSTPDTRVNRR